MRISLVVLLLLALGLASPLGAATPRTLRPEARETLHEALTVAGSVAPGIVITNTELVTEGSALSVCYLRIARDTLCLDLAHTDEAPEAPALGAGLALVNIRGTTTTPAAQILVDRLRLRLADLDADTVWADAPSRPGGVCLLATSAGVLLLLAGLVLWRRRRK